MWLQGKKLKRNSSVNEPNASSVPCVLKARFPWLSITPFGSPVVPEVYMIVARSSVVSQESVSCCKRARSAGRAALSW